MTSLEPTNLPTRCQLESPTTTTSAPARGVGRSGIKIKIWKELEQCRSKSAKVVLVGQRRVP
jgi:hypothetical protein